MVQSEPSNVVTVAHISARRRSVVPLQNRVAPPPPPLKLSFVLLAYASSNSVMIIVARLINKVVPAPVNWVSASAAIQRNLFLKCVCQQAAHHNSDDERKLCAVAQLSANQARSVWNLVLAARRDRMALRCLRGDGKKFGR